jgi:hypothetical protein
MGPIFFWLPLCLLGTYLYLGLLRKFSGLSPILAENSADILTYREAGEAILAGNVPYRDFFIEYPPGSLLAFVPPAFFTTNLKDFATLFASEMALVLVASLVLTAYAARTLLGWWWPLPATAFTVAALLLYPVAVTRYDALVALTLAAAVALVAAVPTRGRTHTAGTVALTAAWASLGFGAAVKLVPALATAPLVLSAGCRLGVSGILRRINSVLLAGLSLRGWRFSAESRLSREPGVAPGEPGGFGADEAGVPGGGGSRARRL